MMIARDVAAAMSGRLVIGNPEARIDTVSIDSRTVQAGDLFFAIHGERFDGHDFVVSAIGSGAAGVVVHRADAVEAARAAASGSAAAGATAVGAASVVIEVEDTTRALQALARDVRRQSGARVVAITGSAGKTTTKEVTAAFLALRYRTFRNKGNLNNHIGLPLSLLELRTRPEMAVVELGMSAPGEIRTLVAIAEPDVRVWTNVGEAHLESFPSVDAIADAKAEILESADRDACLVMNADDPRVVERGRTFAGRVRSFAIEKPADVRATDVEDRGLDGMRATVRISTAFGDAESLRAGSASAGGASAGGGHAGFDPAEKAEAESVTLEIPLLGRANLENVLAGMAVALDAGVPLPAIVERAATLSPASHRGEVTRLVSGVTVLDDAYNANPLAVRRALDVIASEPHARRRVAVLGEMLELGPESVRLHEECGRAAVRSKIDVLVTVGKESARALGEAAVAAGLARDAVSHYADSTAAADAVAALVRPGDVVLVKGSRGVRLERVVERLHGAAS